MQSNIIAKTYPRIVGCYIQLTSKVMAPIEFPSADTTQFLEEDEVFQLTGEVVEYHPVFSELYAKHGGPRFALVSFEAESLLGGPKFWIRSKISFKGPQHRFVNSLGKELTPDYFRE